MSRPGLYKRLERQKVFSVAGRRHCVCVLAVSEVCVPVVDRDQTIQALVGSFATSRDRTPRWVCGWRVPQPGTVSSEEDLVCGARVGIILLGTRWALETDCLLGQKLGVIGRGLERGEGEGSICFELFAGSRHRHPSIWSPRKQFRK